MTMVHYKIFVKLFSDFNTISALLGILYTYFIDKTFQEDFIQLGLMVIILLLNEKLLRYQLKIGVVRSGSYSLFQAIFIHLLFINMVLAWMDIIMKYFNIK